MSSSQTNIERGHQSKEAFLASLSRSVAVPTADWPTVRCWTKTSLDRMFKRVKDEMGESKPPEAHWELLCWIENLGLAWAIEAEGATFYLLEMGAGPNSEVDPLELMMAYEPFGVVCYLSALAFHSLTSQMPSHHHVAVLTESSRLEQNRAAQQADAEAGPRRETTIKKLGDEQRARSKASPLGKVAFRYLDIPYYLTRRTKRLAPGVQNRSHGPRGRFRITTYEQTLLDTLHKPLSCGGPAVVLDAWQEATGSGRLDEERLVAYLAQMDYPSTTRRLGAMLRLMDYTPGDELGRCLSLAKQNVDQDAPYAQISLLPGFDFSKLDNDWLVKSP